MKMKNERKRNVKVKKPNRGENICQMKQNNKLAPMWDTVFQTYTGMNRIMQEGALNNTVCDISNICMRGH